MACDTGELGQCGVGTFVCRDGALSCEGENDLQPESCNGFDDDCDGSIDEDVGQVGRACETGLPGECAVGSFVCEAGVLDCAPDVNPQAEVCDGLDNDCDGEVDEGNPGGDIACQIDGRAGQCGFGFTICQGGQVICDGENDPGPEACDGLDNDCDGTIDEGELPGEGDECDTGFFGTCAAGTLACEGGGLACVQNVEPVAEECDGLDNDCDNIVDEEAIPADAGACPTGLPGVCAEGVPTCTLGAYGCNQVEQAGAEVCDLEDNDCDGRIDEGLRNACGECAPNDPTETCDGEDNDCDGTVDEGDDLCPGDQLCVRGVCADSCDNTGECPDGTQICFDNQACLDPCDAADCPRGWGCRDGQCVDPCVGVDCGPGQACFGGQCVPDTCIETGCDDGFVCIENVCVADPCEGIECQDGEFCRDSLCVGSCADVSCPLDQRCVDGACSPDPCFGVECGAGQLCDEGGCVPDNCVGVACNDGQICLSGQCIDDPCNGVTCPQGETCVEENGEAQCAPDWVPPEQPVDAGVGDPDSGVDLDMGNGEGDGGVPPGREDTGMGGPDPDMDNTGPESEFGVIPTFDMGADGSNQEPEPISGCSCDTADEGNGTALWLLLVGAFGLRRRRR